MFAFLPPSPRSRRARCPPPRSRRRTAGGTRRSLPVAGAGGELVIRHRQGETVVDLRTDEPSELAFAAFYADCIHEIRPVTAGYRIVLVYNLVLQGAAAALLRGAPDCGSQEVRVAAQLRNWEATSAAGDKLVWLLEHDYSEAVLSFEELKNADAALGRSLVRATGRTASRRSAGRHGTGPRGRRRDRQRRRTVIPQLSPRGPWCSARVTGPRERSLGVGSTTPWPASRTNWHVPNTMTGCGDACPALPLSSSARGRLPGPGGYYHRQHAAVDHGDRGRRRGGRLHRQSAAVARKSSTPSARNRTAG